MDFKHFKKKGLRLVGLVAMHLLVVALLLSFLWIVHWLIVFFDAEYVKILGIPLVYVVEVLDAMLIFGFVVFTIQDLYEFTTGRD